MEEIIIALNDVPQFDQVVHKGFDGAPALPQGSTVSVITKDGGTVGGRACAVIAFQVGLPDGTRRTAQATVTVRQLTMALAALRGRYGEDGFAPDTAKH